MPNQQTQNQRDHRNQERCPGGFRCAKPAGGGGEQDVGDGGAPHP